MGDDIQAIKAGIMEIGDVFVINKADRDGVLRTEKELEALLSLAHRPDMWTPPIVKTVATENRGLEELAAAVESYRDFQRTSAGTKGRRGAVARWRILELLRERLLARALEGHGTGARLEAVARWPILELPRQRLLARAREGNGTRERLEALAAEVADKRRDPYSAVEELLAAAEL